VPFLQLTFETGHGEADELEDACFAAGALAVTLSDAADVPIFEPELNTTPLWPRVRVTLLLPAETGRGDVVSALEDALGGPLAQPAFTELADRAWEREWLADFKPMRFGRRLWICPQGQRAPDPQAVIVDLDPGLAFGTGTHPTTALCLEWLDGAALAGRSLIDYGCGSGVLAIAALKLGTRRAFAVDHDPQALLASRENAQRNGVEGGLEVLALPDELPVADVLVANILALPLIELAPRFASLLGAGGELVLSGILTDQADAVAAAHAPWFEMGAPVVREDWVRLHGRRR
jgi:ribosomal protein L11 methyltransferase